MFPTATRQALERAVQILQQGNPQAAEPVLAPLLETGQPDALHLMGLVRLRQQRPGEAVELLARSLAMAPGQVPVQMALSRTLADLDRLPEAIAVLRDAVALQPGYAEAHFALGNCLHDAAMLAEAAQAYRMTLQLAPRHAPAGMALGAVLIEADCAGEAETVLTRALDPGTLDTAAPAALRAGLHYNLALALRAQRKDEAALENFERAQALDPARTGLDCHRAAILHDLGRYDDALALQAQIVAREPANTAAHDAYNQLLYCLGRDSEFLASYDRAPATTPLRLAKAGFLAAAQRSDEAHAAFMDVLAREPDNMQAASGAAAALTAMGRYDEAEALFQQAIARHPHDANLKVNFAAALLRKNDPQKAAAIAQAALTLAPDNQAGLAMLGTAWRLMDDPRDEVLNGYDDLIRIFDLEPPEGFSDMASFNAELNVYLDRVHPHVREYVNQSLRGGTQTPGSLFGAGHALVERLALRIRQALDRYVAEMATDEIHPFLRRRQNGFAFTGSWSSRLRDCGFHTNHVHPGGWISSCYYVGVPDAVADTQARQGWLKFGEPEHGLGLSVRRAVQPAPGRLVLFPSYAWHGTIPFRSASTRTTIAFDVIPA